MTVVEQDVLDLLASTVRTLGVADVDAHEVLQELVDRAAGVFGADDAGILLRAAKDRPQTFVSTSSTARLAEQFQVRTGVGPCIEAFATREPVRVASAASVATRWPEWAQNDLPYESVVGVPFTFDGERIGTLNFLADRQDAFDAQVEAAALRVAEAITVVLLLHDQWVHAEQLAAQLQHALDSRVVIEQAKGVLAERRGITPDEAFVVLRQHSRNAGRKLLEVAQDVTEGRELR